MRSTTQRPRHPIAGLVIPLASLVLVLGAAGPARAQLGGVEGRVSDGVTGQPLSGVQIAVEGTTLITLSNGGGRYLLQGVPAGERTLVFEYVGYAAGAAPGDGGPGADHGGGHRALARTAVQLDELMITGRPEAEAMRRSSRLRGQWGPGHIRLLRRLQHRILRAHRGKRLSPGQRGTPVHLLDRRGPRVVRQRAPLHPVGRAAARRRRPDRGDDQLLPLRVGLACRREHPFSVTTEVWDAPWKREPQAGADRAARRARSTPRTCRPATWSSCSTCPARCGRRTSCRCSRSAFALLVDQLRPQDRVAIVVYAGAAGLVLAVDAGQIASARRSWPRSTSCRPGAARRGAPGLRARVCHVALRALHGRRKQPDHPRHRRRLQRGRVERRRDGAPDRDRSATAGPS